MKKRNYNSPLIATHVNDKLRLGVVAIFFVLVLGALIWRLYSLVVMERNFLANQGAVRSLRVIDIPAYRGMITDRTGAPLAISTPIQSIWVNPKTFFIEDKTLDRLASLLKVSPKYIKRKIQRGILHDFLYLKRQISPNVAKIVAKLNIAGLNFQEEFKRYYPEAESSSQLIGFTNVDDMGIEGLELEFDDWLLGVPGKKRVIKDRLGRTINEIEIIKEPRHGNLLQLSIDKRIQYLVFNELSKTVHEYGAKSGSAIVLDTNTGEVLAAVNAPSYNPNARGRYKADTYRNKVFTDIFEPGSVVKPLSVASALESGLFNKDTVIDTRPSWMLINGHPIRDTRDYGVLDVTGVLQHSSNVGVTKMVMASPPQQLLDVYEKVGFGTRTATGYPGEGFGSVTAIGQVKASPFVLATMGFGYGLSVTTAQLAQSYLPFANEGKMRQLSLLHNNKQLGDTTQVFTQKTASDVLAMMETVMNKDGTGRRGQIKGYRVAGKTGTSRIAGKKGYEASKHIASFVGIAPVSNPRLIVAVVIFEPSRGSYYGGQVAAPLFGKIMARSLRILDVPPDEDKL